MVVDSLGETNTVFVHCSASCPDCGKSPICVIVDLVLQLGSINEVFSGSFFCRSKSRCVDLGFRVNASFCHPLRA